MATIRSREISAALVLQAKSQLKAIYKDNADTITGNCDSQIFLEGEKILVEKEYTLRTLSPEELQQNPAEEFHDMEKAEFLEEFADLHLGEWEKEYEDLNVLDGTQWSVVIKFSSGKAFKSYGSNRFPYNFSGFLDLVRISESDM